MDSNLKNWEITRPCTANWNEMRGDDKRRFCTHCQKHVHNVSAMNRVEREAFSNPANIQECVFYCQRPDGQIADFSFWVVLRRWFPFLRLACWSAILAILPATLTGCWMMGARCESPTILLPKTDKATSPQSTNQPSDAEISVKPSTQ